MSPVLGGVLVFFMRVADMSLDTLRMLFVVRGRKVLAGSIGVVQASVFILAVSAVLKGPLTVWNVLGYSLGFGTGVVLGMLAEDRLALGHDMFRIYSTLRGSDIAEALRKAGHAATEFPAMGRDGLLTLVHCAVARRDSAKVSAIVCEVDPDAFIVIDEVRPLQHGFFRK